MTLEKTKMGKTRCKQTNFTVAAIGSQLQVADEVIFHIKHQKVSNACVCVCVCVFFFKKTRRFVCMTLPP